MPLSLFISAHVTSTVLELVGAPICRKGIKVIMASLV